MLLTVVVHVDHAGLAGVAVVRDWRTVAVTCPAVRKIVEGALCESCVARWDQGEARVTTAV